MKGIICYLSTTGNTKLVCQSIAKKVTSAKWVLHNLADKTIPDLTNYDVVGLATYTDYWGPPQKIQDFLESISSQNGNKPAFILNTHAGESGKTLMILKDWMKSKNFNVIAGHSLLTPLNYPPMLVNGWGNSDFPNEPDIEAFNQFISQLDASLTQIKNGETVPEFMVKLSETDMAFAFYVRKIAQEDMGDLFVDESLCIKCGKCKKVCPYEAIDLTPFPVFDSSKCYGCWGCFNECATKAIYTHTYRNCGHYTQPTEKLKEKLGL